MDLLWCPLILEIKYWQLTSKLSQWHYTEIISCLFFLFKVNQWCPKFADVTDSLYSKPHRSVWHRQNDKLLLANIVDDDAASTAIVSSIEMNIKFPNVYMLHICLHEALKQYPLNYVFINVPL